VARASRALGIAGAPVLVAVSAGADSTALAAALRELREELGLNLSIGHVNHGLRGAASDADEAAVRALGLRLGTPVHCARADPGPERADRSSRDRPTLQEAARDVRYRALHALAERAGARHVATAHTADDQAETLLLRLLRGTGPDGLGGIPERSPDGRVVRPLLRVPRREVESYLRARGLPWREDASNASAAYARNRVRRLLPELVAGFNPRLLRALGDLAEAQRRDSEWIAGQVEREVGARFAPDGAWIAIDVKDWDALPEALARRVARAALERAGSGRHVSRLHLDRMLAFLRGGRPGSHIELPGGLRLVRDRAGTRIGRPGGAC